MMPWIGSKVGSNKAARIANPVLVSLAIEPHDVTTCSRALQSTWLPGSSQETVSHYFVSGFVHG